MADAPTFTVTLWSTLNAETAKSKRHAVTWPVFIAWQALPRPKHAGKFAHPGWSGAEFEPSYRAGKNVKRVTLLVLDVDTGASMDHAVDALRGFQGVLITSKRHTPEFPRFRIVLVVSRPMTPAEYARIWQFMVSQLARVGIEIKVDTQTKDPCRFWYMPSGEPEIRELEGEPLDVDAVLAMVADAPEPLWKGEGPIPEHERNDNLRRYAARLRGKGQDELAILDALRVKNRQCVPPLEDSELCTIARSAAKYEAGVEGDQGTDLATAQLLVRDHGQDLRWCSALGWLGWDGKRWVVDATQLVKRLLLDVLCWLRAEAGRLTTRAAEPDLDEKESKKRLGQARAMVEWCRKYHANYSAEAAIKMASALEPITTTADALDPRDSLGKINLENGTLDLRTFALGPHSREDMSTKLAPVAYDTNATCPLWDAFLWRILGGSQALIDYVQRAMGYTLTGEATEQCFFLLWGGGNNGKSTFLEVLAVVLGSYAQAVRAKTLMVQRDEGIPNDLAAMRAGRFYRCSETKDGGKLNEELIKSWTGGEVIRARFLHKEEFEFKPQGVLWFGTNHKPNIEGTDHAIWRRVRLIPFTVKIPKEEIDKELPRKLLAERVGIFRWMVDGCKAWREKGLGEPFAVAVATKGYRDEQNDFGRFLAEACQLGDNLECTALKLRKAYERWGIGKKLSGKQIGERLKDAGFHSKHTKNGNMWMGLRPIEEWSVFSE